MPPLVGSDPIEASDIEEVDELQSNNPANDIRNSKPDIPPHFPSDSSSSRNGSTRSSTQRSEYEDQNLRHLLPHYSTGKSQAIPRPTVVPKLVRPDILDGGHKPQNSLHKSKLGIGVKRKLSDNDRNGKHQGRKTVIIDSETMDEPSIRTSRDTQRASRTTRRLDDHGRVVSGSRNGVRSKTISENVSSPPTLSSSSVTSQYFSTERQTQRSSRDAQDALERFGEELPLIQAPMTVPKWSNADTRWSGDSKRNAPKRGLLSTKKTATPFEHSFPLVFATQGIKHVEKKSLSLDLRKQGGKILIKICLHGDPQDFDIHKIEECVYEARTTTFGLIMDTNYFQQTGDAFIEFGLENQTDVEKLKDAFKNHFRITIKEKEKLDYCRNRYTDYARRKQHEEQQDRLRNSASKLDSGFSSNRAYSKEAPYKVVATNPEVVIEQPIRKSMRINKGQDNQRKVEGRSSKRSRSSEEADHHETRSSKVLKLELPRPRWKRPLLYPFDGPKRANVDYEDLDRLNSFEFLNDNLINFYLRYIEETLRDANPQLARDTHFLNTFFYERLNKKDEKGKRTVEGVLKWTAKTDIFEKNYVIIPINEASHWYLAIICNLKHLDRRLRREPPVDCEEVAEDSDVTMAEQDVPKQENQEIDDKDKVLAPVSEKDYTVIETRDSLEHMSLDEDQEQEAEWPPDEELEPIDLLIRKRSKETSARKNQVINVDVLEQTNSTSKPKGKAKEKEKKKSSKALPPETPAIIILDSMGPSRHPTTIANIKNWLIREAHNKRSLEMNKEDVVAILPKTPSQNNWYDCGLYVLWYVKRFLDSPKEFVKAFLEKEDTQTNEALWPKGEVEAMRSTLFKKIVELHSQYEEHEKNRDRKDLTPGKNSPTSNNNKIVSLPVLAQEVPQPEETVLEQSLTVSDQSSSSQPCVEKNIVESVEVREGLPSPGPKQPTEEHVVLAGNCVTVPEVISGEATPEEPIHDVTEAMTDDFSSSEIAQAGAQLQKEDQEERDTTIAVQRVIDDPESPNTA